jgi:DNA processing protein
MSEALFYEIALSQIEGVGSVLYRQLVNTFGSAEEVIKAPASKLLKVPNIGKITISNFKENSEALSKAEDIMKKNEKHGISTINFKHKDYPKRLLQIFDAPPILYFKGNGLGHFQKIVAIVGTRQASDYGKESVNQIVSELAAYNVQIISGLAYGVDIAAHKSALKNEMSTVGVLANSLDGVYPESHYKIAQEMLQQGLLISEQPAGKETKPSFFVARNRIIAGMCDAVIVVESAKKGGSMVTAQQANNYNREVFAIPGGIFQKYSEGPNYLISNQMAQIFTNTADLVKWMNWDGTENPNQSKKSNPEIDLQQYSDDEKKVIQALVKNGEMILDDLSWQTQIHLNKLASILLNLEFQDIVKQSPGKKFKIK